jgi:hypothetical protein
MRIFRWREDRTDVCINIAGCNYIHSLPEALEIAAGIYRVRNEIEFPPYKRLDFKIGDRFSFHDDPGPHDPCYVVLPGGAMVPLNHHAGEGVDVARAKWMIDTLNKELERLEQEANK